MSSPRRPRTGTPYVPSHYSPQARRAALAQARAQQRAGITPPQPTTSRGIKYHDPYRRGPFGRPVRLRRTSSITSRGTVQPPTAAARPRGGVRIPRQASSAAQKGGGLLLGVLAYSMGLNYVRYGWPGVRRWFAAKFLNDVGNPSEAGKGGTGGAAAGGAVLQPPAGTVMVPPDSAGILA